LRGKTGYFYPQTTKRMLVAVLNIMSGIVVYKYDKNGQIIGDVPVEILSGPAQVKHRGRTNEDQMEYFPKFPRIEVHYEGMNFDEDRLVSPETKRFWNAENVNVNIKDHEDFVLLDLNGLFADFSPIPYNYVFSINIFAEYIDHISQIIENIFPYFTPANTTLRVKEFDFLNIQRDIKITLGNPAIQFDSQDIVAGDRRQVSCNFSLTLDGYMYRKVEASKIINSSICKIFVDPSPASNVMYTNNVIYQYPALFTDYVEISPEIKVEYDITIIPNTESIEIKIGSVDEFNVFTEIKSIAVDSTDIVFYNRNSNGDPLEYNSFKILPWDISTNDVLPYNSKIEIIIPEGFIKTVDDKPIKGFGAIGDRSNYNNIQTWMFETEKEVV